MRANVAKISPARQQPSQPSEYDEERVPFLDVVRKLVSTPPAHKAAKPAQAKKTPKPKKG